MWNAEIYEQYGKERIQPSIDLVNRIRERRCEKILEFLKGAALRPYMEILRGEELEAFMNQVLENMKKAYPVQKNGKVIFPFRRLFVVGEKKRTK